MSWKIADFFTLEGCPCPQTLEGASYPWEILSLIPVLIKELVEEFSRCYTQIAEGVWVGPGTTVADTARFLGPAIFGADCQIRPGAFVRDNVIAGDRVVLGNASEVKQAILFSGVQMPHFNYVGDSILGRGAHLGAGAIVSNYKSTKELVKVTWEGKIVETGLRKFGAILGDDVEIGCNTVINPGTLIGTRSIIYPLSSVRGYVPAEMIYKSSGEVVSLRMD